MLNENVTIKKKDIIINQNYFYILLIAFIGGLILNAMPCVLPILSIKLISILKNLDNKSSIQKSFFTTSLGIIFSFIMLAISFIFMRNLGYSIGWGIQFQQPIFLMTIGLILTLFALNLFGFFEFNVPQFLNFSFIRVQDNSFFKDFFNGFFCHINGYTLLSPFYWYSINLCFYPIFLISSLYICFYGYRVWHSHIYW